VSVMQYRLARAFIGLREPAVRISSEQSQRVIA
jgi:hypothetical protein